MRVGIGESADKETDMAAEQVVERRARALVGDMDELHAGAVGKKLHGQMIEGARPGRAVGNGRGRLPAHRDQLLQ